MKYPLCEKAAKFVEENTQAFIDLTAELAVIPAPSNHEEKRAEWCKKHFESFGATGVYIDQALNVVWPVNCEGRNDIIVIMAHTDVVFPDTTPLPLKIENGKMCAPGVGDDTANLTGLLTVARYVKQAGLTPKTGVLFVANSGEEGLGNLKGSTQIMKDYAGRVKEFISFDGYYNGVVNNAVGSQRYRVTVKTEGGHSYGAFGNRNAIYYLAKLIDTLYGMKVPSKAKTTFNVGMIEGGTSVNTIAQEASMMYEFRSEDKECLAIMEKMFLACVEAYRNMGITIDVEVLGVRPCKGDVDETALSALIQKTVDIVSQYADVPPLYAGSTDCNIPLSQGVPAVCTGIVLGGGAHTREEWIEISSMNTGLKIAMNYVLTYFN